MRDFPHHFQGRGAPALYPDRPGPAPDDARRGRATPLPRELLGQGRTWASRQLAGALPPHGVGLGDRQARRHLELMKAGCRRTASTLGHEQGRAKAGRAGAALTSLEKEPRLAS